VPANYSYGSAPDGQPFDRILLYYATPAGSNAGANTWPPLRLNEWMASNTGFIRDPADHDTDDWLEIYNPTATPVDLTGWSLTDTPSGPAGFEVPGGYTVPAYGHLLVWADNETGQNSTNRPDLHVNFKLEKEGESIGLFAPDGTLIDSVTFGLQTNNVSQGRSPDGGTNLLFFPLPTPGNTNLNRPPAPWITRIELVEMPPGSAPTMKGVSLSGGTLNIAVTTVPGAPYQIRFKSNLAEVSWTPLRAPIMATDAELSVLDDMGTSRQRFYQAVALPVSGVKITFTTTPGFAYRVDYKDTSTAETWTPLTPEQMARGAVLSVTNGLRGGTQRFYRVVAP